MTSNPMNGLAPLDFREETIRFRCEDPDTDGFERHWKRRKVVELFGRVTHLESGNLASTFTKDS
jgi:hypothetical protein